MAAESTRPSRAGRPPCPRRDGDLPISSPASGHNLPAIRRPASTATEGFTDADHGDGPRRPALLVPSGYGGPGQSASRFLMTHRPARVSVNTRSGFFAGHHFVFKDSVQELRDDLRPGQPRWSRRLDTSDPEAMSAGFRRAVKEAKHASSKRPRQHFPLFQYISMMDRARNGRSCGWHESPPRMTSTSPRRTGDQHRIAQQYDCAVVWESVEDSSYSTRAVAAAVNRRSWR